MSDSDDNYFSDDLVLDDKTLAILDEEESKFQRSTQIQNNVGPPTKRQRTSDSWQRPAQPIRTTLHRADTMEDMYDLPDVSIRKDGTYGLQDKQRRPSGPPSRSGTTPGPSPVASASSGTRSNATAPPMRSASVSGPGSVRATHVPSRPPSVARSAQVAQSPIPSQEVCRTQPGPNFQRLNRVSSTTVSDSHVDRLLQQIEELRKEKETMHAKMEAALEAKFAKEGEVSILRKRIEKTAQDHMAQLAKLKLAKDEADAKQVSLQKQYELDKERLKTELTFRRHELEAASRKNLAALSPRRDASHQAERLSSQRQRSGQWNFAGHSQLALEASRRPRFGVISEFEKSKKTNVPETRDLPSGFQTGPSRSQFMVGHKGKETVSFPNASPVVPSASLLPQDLVTQFRQQTGAFGTQINGAMEDFIPPVEGGIDDVPMLDEGTPAMTQSSQENTAIVTLPDRNLLHDIILTHRLQGSKLSTLQLIMCASPADPDQTQSYGVLLMRIFDTLGGNSTHTDGDLDDAIQMACFALCEVAESLTKNNLVPPMTAVLNLLTKIAYVLPSTRAFFLAHRVPDQDETPRLLRVLHTVIQDQLQRLDITNGDEVPELRALAKEALSLYEMLVWWRTPDGLEDCLVACLGMPSVLTALIHPHRPVWFLVESMRVLLWLSTRLNLFLLHPAREQRGSNGECADPIHHTQIGLLCSLLTDIDRQGPEADELKSRIIMLFGVLSNVHPDAYTLLIESQELIPSIVLYLYHLITLIWDEEGAVCSDPRAATRTIRIVNDTMLLFHHLVTGEGTTLDLRERLLPIPNTLYHCFTLTLGRLSYANPPDQLDKKDRERLEGVANLARALLERVIQGPELDLIWESYQDEGEDVDETAMDVDEEEEASKMIASL